MQTIDQDTGNLDRMQDLRDRHVGRLLLQAQRAFNARAVEKLRQLDYGRLTLAHIALLPHLDIGGTRITTLAERAGMTKQGMGQLVLDLERQGYVTRTPDPDDRRAVLVRFSEAGRGFLRDAVAVTSQLESEYAALLGPRRLEDLRSALSTIIEHERQGT